MSKANGFFSQIVHNYICEHEYSKLMKDDLIKVCEKNGSRRIIEGKNYYTLYYYDVIIAFARKDGTAGFDVMEWENSGSEAQIEALIYFVIYYAGDQEKWYKYRECH